MSDQPNAVRLQDRLMQLANLEANELAEVMQQAADRIEADEALMRQASDALTSATRHAMPGSDVVRRCGPVITALRKRLESSK